MTVECRLRQPGGSWSWASMHAAPVLDDAGQVLKWVGMTIDITDRKLAASERRQALLAHLGETLRPLAEPAAIQREAARAARASACGPRALLRGAGTEHDGAGRV